MRRLSLFLARVAVIVVLAGCGKDSGAAKTDSAAADSIRNAHGPATFDTSPAATGSTTDSIKAPVNSTEGTIGETRKPPRVRLPDTVGRDSVVHGPYKTMDSLGRIKR